MIPKHDLELCPFNCRQLVLITRTERGRELAVNPVPDPKGNTAVWRISTGAWRSRSLAGREAMPLLSYEEIHMPHVATSPGCRPTPSLPGLATLAVRTRTHTARLPYPNRRPR